MDEHDSRILLPPLLEFCAMIETACNGAPYRIVDDVAPERPQYLTEGNVIYPSRWH